MRPNKTRLTGVLLSLVAFSAALPANGRDEDAPIRPNAPGAVEFFEAEVRPILAENCLECHGAHKQTNGLRLDSRAAVLKGGAIEGPAVYLDDPAGSPLMLAVRGELAVPMPPKPSPGLSPAQVDTLERWLEMGMPWTDEATIPTPEEKADAAGSHWAFQPIQDPEPPAVEDDSWVANPVDAFVLDRLEGAGLTPSPRADRRTLIRRVTFDLTGLPPTPGEIRAFLDDPGTEAEALARVVDRLLASPAYGERWGRHWLDVARYADNKGYVFQEERRYPFAYTYRDYVVDAFNEDKPFDRFVREQVAADRIELEETSDLAALGFLTVGSRFRNNSHDVIDDRIDVVTRGLMGLTVACARCHDHKYDPIPTADYYSLYGVFASSAEPDSLPRIGEPEPGPQADDYRKQVAEKEKAIAAFLAEQHEAFQQHLSDYLESYFLGALELEFDPGHGKLDDVARAREVDPKRLRSFVDRLRRHLDRTKAGPDPVFAPWHALAALPAERFAEEAPGVLESLAGEATNPINPVVAASLTESPPATFQEVVERYARVFASGGEAEGEGEEPGRAEVRALLADAEGPFIVPEDQAERLLNRAERNGYRDLQRQLDLIDVNHPAAPPRAMVLNDKDELFNPYIFLRGTAGNRGPEVPRRFLELIEGDDREPFRDGSGREELAEAIVSPDNPLTARVLVNRVWMYHFDAPLVATPSDFGTRSTPPTHPELLDWLATRFQQAGWSIKAMHRLILASNAYAQQSLDRPEAALVDSQNSLLWRQNRRRLDLEAMRDAMLAVSGRLDDRLGGRPVGGPDDPGGTRRTLYSFIDRQNLPAVFRTFDFPNPSISSPGRNETTVPQQALFLLNSPFVAAQAQHLADLAEESAGDSADPDGRIDWIYRRLFGRPATAREIGLGRRFLETPAEAPGSAAPSWQYGYGGLNEATGKVAAFTPFPHFTGESWQFGPEMPHPEGGHLHLKAVSGHVGPGPDRAAIRRWIAQADATIAIEGRLSHENDKGDGVRGRIVAGRSGVLGDWTAHNGRASTQVERYEVKAGEAIDFVADCRGDQSYDSFVWAPRIRAIEGEGAPATWEARVDFRGPAPEPLTPDERLAQVLLMTNEFLFVD